MNRLRLHWLTTVLLVLSPVVSAQDVSKSADAGNTLYADVIDIAPWGRTGPGGRPAGVYAALFTRLSDLSACPLEQRLTPIPRAVAEVSRSTAHATIMLDRADLNEDAVALGEVTRLQIELWLPKGSKLRSVDDLAGKRVGVLRGPSYHEVFDRDTRIQKYPVTSPRNQLEMLSKGRLDAAIGVRENFITALSTLHLGADEFASPVVLEQRVVKLWVSTSLRGSRCAAGLTKALSELRRTGEVDRLVAEAIARHSKASGAAK